MKRQSPKQTAFARQLRRNQTEAEKTLWKYLRSKQFNDTKFRRQHPVGPYIADFACIENKLIVEVDGGQHNEQQNSSHDMKRTEWLKDQGYQILRFWNNDVLTNTDGVREKIWGALNENSPSL